VGKEVEEKVKEGKGERGGSMGCTHARSRVGAGVAQLVTSLQMPLPVHMRCQSGPGFGVEPPPHLCAAPMKHIYRGPLYEKKSPMAAPVRYSWDAVPALCQCNIVLVSSTLTLYLHNMLY
jgi:hypothetical protein